jgi:thiol-disulfide isomerase/thioredoxin
MPRADGPLGMSGREQQGGPISVNRIAAILGAMLCALALAGAATPARPEIRKVDANRILKLIREAKAEVVVVNVWATWCMPCREEFPDLLRLRKEYADRGLDLILVSGDFSDDWQDQVGSFLRSKGVDFVTYIKEGDDMRFINTLNRQWSGALPATLFYGPEGRLRDFWEGKADYARMKSAVEDILQNKEKQ